MPEIKYNCYMHRYSLFKFLLLGMAFGAASVGTASDFVNLTNLIAETGAVRESALSLPTGKSNSRPPLHNPLQSLAVSEDGHLVALSIRSDFVRDQSQRQFVYLVGIRHQKAVLLAKIAPPEPVFLEVGKLVFVGSQFVMMGYQTHEKDELNYLKERFSVFDVSHGKGEKFEDFFQIQNLDKIKLLSNDIFLIRQSGVNRIIRVDFKERAFVELKTFSQEEESIVKDLFSQIYYGTAYGPSSEGLFMSPLRNPGHIKISLSGKVTISKQSLEFSQNSIENATDLFFEQDDQYLYILKKDQRAVQAKYLIPWSSLKIIHMVALPTGYIIYEFPQAVASGRTFFLNKITLQLSNLKQDNSRLSMRRYLNSLLVGTEINPQNGDIQLRRIPINSQGLKALEEGVSRIKLFPLIDFKYLSPEEKIAIDAEAAVYALNMIRKQMRSAVDPVFILEVKRSLANGGQFFAKTAYTNKKGQRIYQAWAVDQFKGWARNLNQPTTRDFSLEKLDFIFVGNGLISPKGKMISPSCEGLLSQAVTHVKENKLN